MKLTRKILALTMIVCFSVMMFVTGCTSAPASKMEEVGQEIPKEEEEVPEESIDKDKLNPDEFLDCQIKEFKDGWHALAYVEKSVNNGEMPEKGLKTVADLYEKQFSTFNEEIEKYESGHELNDKQKKACNELKGMTIMGATYCSMILGDYTEDSESNKDYIEQALERYNNLYNSK
ncbi:MULTISPECIES: hypothetical protein [unclassified Clostridioides]|uniref:hypothetical protein n=1 Tax=unclassified Clostridioides TaxID=2635829 RepID=UPI001D1123D2|nr:hypothetical protein [Clostridioides sp. ZZV14-6154]MCC0719047.1 hypothetical protein [Clostridioides sp. ZZV14-6105]MCC0720791.1 hypothetical protein [Clostridioides sp. ZZV14-6104]MCC0741400.1 hypothetical protein [Clostridioides sp. ZZV14-6044]MCC0752776.1 hypothetical protein [Clostridioides sp. ZZV13-5731]WLD28583.1 hypothetical protein CDIFMA2_24670 [Clostridioides difficile]